MSSPDFPTAILTSKSPDEVADYIPHALHLSSTLIEKNLSVWFANYIKMLGKYNADLNSLITNGRNFFSDTHGEFGSIDKIWNCVASSVMSQIQVNEAMIEAMKNDILGPFRSAFKDDFKYSELLVNSNELAEMQGNLDDKDGAYRWNVQAPAILSNFENFKRFEKELLFNAFITYLNTVNTKTASLVDKNENAMNFILKEYQIDQEMSKYRDHFINTKSPPRRNKGVSEHSAAPPHKNSAPLKSSRASMISSSASTGPTPTKEKRNSKLRSKVGSIFGRKKKTSSLNHSETIQESDSVSSLPSRQGTFVSRSNRNSLYNAPIGSGSSKPKNRNDSALSLNQTANNSPEKATPQTPELRGPSLNERGFSERPSSARGLGVGESNTPATDAVFESPKKEARAPAPQFTNSVYAEPLKPSTPAAVEKPSESTAFVDVSENGPNFVKYDSSDEESDVPLDSEGKRLSLLNAHELGQPPRVDTESDSRSRNTSSGKYSFEVGDEAKSISTPQHTPVVTQAPRLPSPVQQTENKDEATHAAPAPANTAANTAAAGSSRAPPPPPSRKVHPSDLRRDSLYSREPAQPQSYRDHIPHLQSADRMSLVSQTTGNSLFKRDYFQHFNASTSQIKEGLNTSIAEIVNASFVDGEVAKSQVLGEIAFNLNSPEAPELLPVQIPTKFARYLLNEQVMTKGEGDSYLLKSVAINGRTVGGIKYQIESKVMPVLVKQIWKFEEHQASLIIKIALNPEFSSSIKLENFVVSAALDTSVRSTSAMSKPEGAFNKDTNRITWKYTKPLELDVTNPETKLIARIMTEGQAKESKSGSKLRFIIGDGVKSYVEILDSQNQPIPSITSLGSGNYSSFT